MQTTFTQRMAGATIVRLQFYATTAWLLLFLLLTGNTVSAQTIVDINPKCVTVGESVSLVITGNSFDTNNNGAVVRVNNGTTYIQPSSKTATSIVVTIPADRITAAGTLNIAVGNRSTGNTYNFSPDYPVAALVRPTASNGVSCGPGRITLSAAGAPVGGSYRWFTVATGGTAIAGETGSSYTTPSLASTTTYYVAAVTSVGCETSRTAVQAVVVNPVAKIVPTGPLKLCQGTTTTLSATEAPAGETYNYQWYNGQVAISPGGNRRDLVVAETGKYNVVITTGNGCISAPSEEVTVMVNPLPAVPAEAPAVKRCGPGALTLSATPGEGGSTIRWYSESAGGTLLQTGLTYSTELQASSIFYAATYNPETGCESARSRVEATVFPVPLATIQPVAPKCQNPIAGETTDFLLNGNAQNGTLLRWAVESGNASIDASGANTFTPTVKVTGAGTVRVSLTVQGSAEGSTCEPAVAFIDLVVNPIPEAFELTAPPVQICGPGQVTLSVSGAPSGYSYNWYDAPNGGNLLRSGATFTTTVTQSRSFYVAVTGGGDCDNPKRTEVAAVVNPVPAVPTNVTASPTALCGAGTATLSATAGTNGTTVRWYSASTGGALLATNPTYTPSVNATTTYYAASYNATTGCESSTRVAATVTVNTAPAQPTVNNLTANKTYYTGERYNGNYYFTLSGSNPPPGGTAVFSGPGVSQVSGAYRFTPCNALLANESQSNINITYTVRNANGTCESATVTPVVVKRSTYTIVLQTNPFPVCPSINTNYTARVLRDAVVTYPAPENIRTQPVTVVSSEEDVTNLFKIESGIARGDETPNYNRGATFSNSSLTSEDFYLSRATPTGALPPCANVTQLLSNRIYLGRPEVTVSMANAGSVCPGTQVSFTATPSSFPGTLTYQWTVNGAPVDGAISNTFSSSTLKNGDVVAVSYNAASSSCGAATSSNAITMVVATPQTVTGGSYCAGTSGFPIAIGSSQTGVRYQLVQLVNGTPINVGAARAGTGSSLSFGNQLKGTYAVIPIAASGAACQMFNEVTVTENALTAITAAPQAQTVCAGSAASFSVAATGTDLAYQWLKGGNMIPNANASTYSIPAAAAADAASYSVRVTGACGTVTSGAVALTVNQPVTATAPGANQTICAGSPVSFSVSAAGTGLNYQWLKNGVAIPGVANSSTYSIANANAGDPDDPNDGDAGSYAVKITGTCTPEGITVAMGALTVNPVLSHFGEMKVTWVNNETQWKVEALTTNSGINPLYQWYTRDNISDNTAPWVEQANANPDPSVFILDNPTKNMNLGVRVVVTRREAGCVQPLVVDLTNENITPLPVEIIYLNATRQGNEVLLEWATAMEQDNAGFEVQVSTDGFNYRKLAFVATKNGNASTKQVYTFTDRESGKYGTRYYRLKQQDIQGIFEYFGPKAVSFGSVASRVIAFPNPFHDEVTLDIAAEEDGQALVVVTDAVGKTLLERKVRVSKGFTTEKLRLDANLPNGMYIIRTQVGGVTQYLKMIKE